MDSLQEDERGAFIAHPPAPAYHQHPLHLCYPLFRPSNIAATESGCRNIRLITENVALATNTVSYGFPKSISLPPLPGLDALSEPIASLVLTLNRLGTRRDNPVLASMYRHLAYWPGYLAVSWALIAPLDAGGSLERAIADALTKARTQAARLALRLRPPPLDPAAEEAVRSAVEAFAGDVIAKMVVICTLLHAATRDQAQKEGRPA